MPLIPLRACSPRSVPSAPLRRLLDLRKGWNGDVAITFMYRFILVGRFLLMGWSRKQPTDAGPWLLDFSSGVIREF